MRLTTIRASYSYHRLVVFCTQCSWQRR